MFSPLFAAYVASREPPAPIALTALETRLWARLQEQPGALLSRDQLIDVLYGSDLSSVSDEALTALVARLRRKLQLAGLGTIEAVRGLGYRYLPAGTPC